MSDYPTGQLGMEINFAITFLRVIYTDAIKKTTWII